MAADKLEPLHVRIGRLREQARVATPRVREEVGLEDAAIRVVAGLAGKSGAERREALGGVQVGNTVTAQGAAKTALTRDQKLAKTVSWAKDWTQDQRDQYIVSDKFEALSDRQQEIISEAFDQVEDRAYEDALGIQNIDYDAPTPDVDEIVGDDEDDDEAEANDLGDSDYEAMFEQAAWEAEQT
jgi:hypothetical protein